MDLAQRAEAIIREYEEQGWHRTGTDVDLRSAEWLAALVREAGLEPELAPIDLDRIEIFDSHLDVDGRRIEGVPLFDGAYTDAVGIQGTLTAEADARDSSHIVVMRTPANGIPEELSAIRRGNADAIVAITDVETPGLALLNAPDFLAPHGPPVLQVSNEDRDWLVAAAGRGANAQLVTHVRRVRTQAFNVLATSGTGPFVLGVNTPRSGWWQCASERGGGIVCWLETMRAVVAAQLPVNVFFSATTGHELGFLGFDRLLAERADVRGMPRWIHYGASIGCASATKGRLMASDLATAERAESLITQHGGRPLERTTGAAGGGEMKAARAHGASCWVAFTNENKHFHMTSDRIETNVSIPGVVAYARAFSELTTSYAREAAVTVNR